MTETGQTPASAGARIDGDGRPRAAEGGSTPEAETSGAGERRADKGIREARDRYRGERDTARDELTAAKALIDRYQRAEVGRLSAELAQPSDLFGVGGASLGDLLNEDGDVDSTAVAEAVAALIEARPGLAKNPHQRAVDLTQGLGGHGVPQPSFLDLFR